VNTRYVRLRYTATGALAALAAAGAIAGTVALADNPPTKTPASPAPSKTGAPPPPGNSQPFLDDVERLVDNGTLTAAQGQVLDGEIEAGQVHTEMLAAAGFTQAQLQAVQQALSATKQSMAPGGPSAGQDRDRRTRRK
jgi:hypothetical protein